MTIPFELALYESFQFISKENHRYDLDHILIEENKVVSTDGKRLYVANVEDVPCTGIIKLSKIKGGPHYYPKPKKNLVKNGSAIVEEHGIKFLETLGTRFRYAAGDMKFPPYEKILPQSPELTVLESPKLFMDSLKDLRKHGKDLAQEHLFSTGEKIKPQHRGIIYRNGSLHLVLECSIGENTPYMPIFHCELAENIGGSQSSMAVFNLDLYALKEPPLAIGLGDFPIIFQLKGRQILIMPIKIGEPPEYVSNFLHWEEYELEELQSLV